LKILSEKTEWGGLGLFRVKQFLDSQKCSWVKRALAKDDDWKKFLFVAANGKWETLNADKIDKAINPVMHEIARAFGIFYKNFVKCNENYKAAPIFENKNFVFRPGSDFFLTRTDFGELWDGYKVEIANININHIFEIDRYTTVERFEDLTGIPITYRLLVRMRAIFETARIKYGKKNAAEKKTESLLTLLGSFKKGSRKFRKYLSTVDKVDIPHNINKFSENMEIITSLEKSKILNKLWTISYLENETRTFLFKFHNNTLPLNYSLSKYVRGIEPYCTFCTLTRNQEPELETPLHLFFTCTISERVINRVISIFTGEILEVRRTDFFSVYERINAADTKILMLACIFIKKHIWDCKLRKTIPTVQETGHVVISSIFLLSKMSSTVREIIRLSTIPMEAIFRTIF